MCTRYRRSICNIRRSLPTSGLEILLLWLSLVRVPSYQLLLPSQRQHRRIGLLMKIVSLFCLFLGFVFVGTVSQLCIPYYKPYRYVNPHRLLFCEFNSDLFLTIAQIGTSVPSFNCFVWGSFGGPSQSHFRQLIQQRSLLSRSCG